MLITRPREQAEELARAVRAAGGVPCVVPCICTVPLEDPLQVQESLQGLGPSDWLVLTSARTVRLLAEGVSWSQVQRSGVRVAAVGEATRRAAEEAGLCVHLVPAQANAGSLAEALLEPLARQAGKGRVLFPRARGGREELVVRLAEHAVQVEVIEIYQTVGDPGRASWLRATLDEGPLDLLTVASPSTVLALRTTVDELGLGYLLELPVVCVGPVTARQARSSGFCRVWEAAAASAQGLVDTCVQALL